MVTLALVCLVAITMVRGKRLELIIALLPLFLLLWSTRLKRPLYRVGAVALAVLTISSLASLRYGEIPDVASLAFNTFSEGLYAGHVTPGVIEALDQHWIQLEYGLRYLAAFAAFIPRFIFPSKDEVIYQSLTDMIQFAPLGATSMLAEVYLQGATVAILISFGFVGALSRTLELKTLAADDGQLPFKAVLYLVFVCSFVPHFRDGLIPSIKIPLQLIFVVCVVVLGSGDRLRRRLPLRRNQAGDHHFAGAATRRLKPRIRTAAIDRIG